MSLSLLPALGRPSPRRRGTIAVAGVLALGAAAVPALAGCGSASVFACGVRNDETAALPVSATSITSVVFPRNDNDGLSFRVYDALVPAGFSPAADRQVAVQLTRYDLGHCQPTGGAPAPASVPAPPCREAAQAGTTSWVEGSVAIAVTRGSDAGWLPISSPYSSASELADAAAVGIPAYAAGGDVVVTGTTGAKGTATKGAAPQITLDWTKVSTPVPASAFDLAQGSPSVFSTTTGTPATPWRTSRNLRATAPALELVTPPNSALSQPGLTATGASQRGQVRLQLAAAALPVPDRTLGDLVLLDQITSGLLRQEDGLLITKRDNLTDGTDGPLPQPPPTQAVVVTGPAGQTTGFLNPLVVVTEGGTWSYANQDTVEHTVTSVRTGADGKPLFEAIGPAGTTTDVKGVSSLEPGLYDFLCALHSSMTGKLIVG